MKLFNTLLILLLMAGFVSCSKKNKEKKEETESTTVVEEQPQQNVTAEAVLEPKSGSKVHGTVTFKELEDGAVMYTVSVTGLDKNSVHAIHIHETGDCSAEDGSSAGGHWNPMGEEHGKMGEGEFHLGDIGNLDANEDGVATLSGTNNLWTLTKDSTNNIRGHAIIIHEKADDFKTQPTGNAGSRVACGVIN